MAPLTTLWIMKNFLVVFKGRCSAFFSLLHNNTYTLPLTFGLTVWPWSVLTRLNTLLVTGGFVKLSASVRAVTLARKFSILHFRCRRCYLEKWIVRRKARLVPRTCLYWKETLVAEMEKVISTLISLREDTGSITGNLAETALLSVLAFMRHTDYGT